LGREARNHPCVPRPAPARGTNSSWSGAAGLGLEEERAWEAGPVARRCAGLEHGQFWRARELGLRARSPRRCTTREVSTVLSPPRGDTQQLSEPGCSSPTTGG